MRPLIITPLYPPAVGGAASYFGGLVPGLLRRPEVEQLTLLTERLPGEAVEWSDGKLRLLRRLPSRVGRVGRPGWWHALSYVHTQLWFSLRLPRLAQQSRADFIHFHTRYGGRLFFRALRRSGLPVLADLRDKMSDPAQLAQVAGRLLVCAQGVRDFAIAGGFPGAAVDLVPVLFNRPDQPSPSQPAQLRRQFLLGDSPFLLFAGDITPNKGVYELLHAFASWRQRHPGVKLLLAGTNRQGNAFLRRAGTLPDVHYLGQIARPQLLALMQAAELVVLPSRSEGLPTVILEAVSLGTRVVCPPGIPEFEAHLPQFVLPQVSPAAIEATLERVWCSDERPRYPLEAHRPQNVIDGVAAVYRRLIS